MTDSAKEKITGYLEEIQEINFRLLCEIDRICTERGIRYYLLAGTLLGAVRHKDFIPWDDDVDIVFVRRDYERFLRIFREEATGPYQLVDYHDYPEFFDFICRIVDSSVKIRNQKADEDYYGGRYSHPGVDLFVFDDAAPFLGARLFALRVVYAMAMGHRQRVEYEKYSGLQKLGAYVLPAIGRFIPLRVLARLYDAISSAGNGGSDSWFISNEQQRPPYWGKLYRKAWFARRVRGQIRDRFFPCAKGAPSQLRMIYGDYMALPPEDKRYPQHFAAMELEREKEG
ncbi:MAG: LicD family protein [Lachnospiraceae bacterium]|nr:LicD family protein [Lachnospiraceae bacterium]